MNAAHFHLIVNHLPIIFPIAGVIILITGFIFKSEPIKRTAFLIFIIGSLSSIAAVVSGEGATKIVENISGVTEDYIERHEEIAERFAILSYILGGFSLFGLWASVKQKKFSQIANIVILIFAFIVIYFAKETGTTGGEIRHTEIRTNNIETPVIKEQKHSEEEKD